MHFIHQGIPCNFFKWITLPNVLWSYSLWRFGEMHALTLCVAPFVHFQRFQFEIFPEMCSTNHLSSAPASPGWRISEVIFPVITPQSYMKRSWTSDWSWKIAWTEILNLSQGIFIYRCKNYTRNPTKSKFIAWHFILRFECCNAEFWLRVFKFHPRQYFILIPRNSHNT